MNFRLDIFRVGMTSDDADAQLQRVHVLCIFTVQTESQISDAGVGTVILEQFPFFFMFRRVNVLPERQRNRALLIRIVDQRDLFDDALHPVRDGCDLPVV